MSDPTPPDETLSDRYRADNSGWSLVSKRTGLSIQTRLSEWFKADYVEQIQAELTAARLSQQETERQLAEGRVEVERLRGMILDVAVSRVTPFSSKEPQS